MTGFSDGPIQSGGYQIEDAEEQIRVSKLIKSIHEEAKNKLADMIAGIADDQNEVSALLFNVILGEVERYGIDVPFVLATRVKELFSGDLSYTEVQSKVIGWKFKPETVPAADKRKEILWILAEFLRF